MGKPFDDLGDMGARIDDRWTSQKLAQAGYEFQNERSCGLCQTTLAVYKKRQTSHRDKSKWLFLDSVTLEPHRC